nr:hypothetical protein [Acinetobacter bereziniae]
MKNLNQTSLEISAMGLGCMGMSEFYGQTDDQNSLRILEQAFDSGINFLIPQIPTDMDTTKNY